MINKTFTKILSLGLGIIIVTSTLMILVYRSYYEKQAKTYLQSTAKIVSYELNCDNDYSFINNKFDDNIRLTIIDSNGVVLSDNIENPGIMDNHSDRPEFKEALKNGQGSTIRKSTTIDENTYYYAVKLNNDNVLRIALTRETMFVIFYESLYYIAAIILIVIILSLAISYTITKSIVKPITDIGKNLDNIDEVKTFEELEPFINSLKEHKRKNELLDKQKKEFTANISHELKTPLTSIAGYAELIESGIAKEQDIKPFTHTIRNQALRLVSLTEDIIKLSELDTAKSDNVSFERINLKDICERCTESLEMNAKSKNIEINLNTKDCYIDANESLIEEMVYNLIDNAIRYNKENGKLSITVDDKKSSICVEDTGIGIPEKYQQRIFERFFRVDKSRSKETGGTGLGLAIVKHIANVHNAKIEIDSKENIGTKIEIIF